MDGCVSASLIPYKTNGNDLDTGKEIPFDFNPETLALEVRSGEQSDRRRRGNQQVQHVGASTATLSFDAIFDMTRPSEQASQRPGAEQGEGAQSEDLDVRRKTLPIALLLQVEKKGKKPSPRRVRFCWGNFLFDGIIKSYSENFDYFSAEGVPLRSKVSLRIEEQDFRYSVEPAEARQQQREPSANEAKEVAQSNGLDSLFDLSEPGGSFSLRADLDVDLQLDVGFDVDVGVDVGLDADLGLQAGAGFSMSADAALDVFGSASLQANLGAGVDLGLALRGALGGRTAVATSGSAWAPAGPAPGTSAAEIAASVHQNRAFGRSTDVPRAGSGNFQASDAIREPAVSAAAERERLPGTRDPLDDLPAPLPARITPPLPVQGSPPLAPARYAPRRPEAAFARERERRPELPANTARRPSWERVEQRLPAAGAEHRCCDAASCCCDELRERRRRFDPW